PVYNAALGSLASGAALGCADAPAAAHAAAAADDDGGAEDAPLEADAAGAADDGAAVATAADGAADWAGTAVGVELPQAATSRATTSAARLLDRRRGWCIG